jgi:hypothetical protein
VTLELFLNLTWLGIAIGALSAFAVWARAEKSEGHRLQVGIAVLCGLALLFPIISVTDDMSTDAAALEEWSAARRAALIIVNVAHAAVAIPVVTAIEQTAKELFVCIGLVVLTFSALASATFATARSLRAPPFARR